MAPERAAPPCAHCRHRPIDPRWRPFCSERCRLLDLGRWLDGAYRIPGEPAGAGDEPEPTGPNVPERDQSD